MSLLIIVRVVSGINPSDDVLAQRGSWEVAEPVLKLLHVFVLEVDLDDVVPLPPEVEEAPHQQRVIFVAPSVIQLLLRHWVDWYDFAPLQHKCDTFFKMNSLSTLHILETIIHNSCVYIMQFRRLFKSCQLSMVFYNQFPHII